MLLPPKLLDTVKVALLTASVVHPFRDESSLETDFDKLVTKGAMYFELMSMLVDS